MSKQADPIDAVLSADDESRLERLDALALQAPISYEMVIRINGSPVESNDVSIACFMAVWVSLCYAWADAMLWEQENQRKKLIQQRKDEQEFGT